jgi:Protein of unknown function (DUF1367)
MKVYLTKTMIGLIPADERSREWFNKLKLGESVHADFKKIRNYRFLRKYFALLNLAYDSWEPGEVNSKYGVPEKSFDRFRADLTILSGYYESTIRLDGSVRIEPKSISFAKMSEEEFEKLYSATITVLIKHVYGPNMNESEIRSLVEKYLEFA